MQRFALPLGLVVTLVFCATPLAAQSTLDSPAQSIINKPMSPPPAAPKPRDSALVLREVRGDLHAPVRFSVSPNSEMLALRLYQERGVNAVLGPGGNRDSSELVPMCSPPCEMSLRSRAYVFGVSTGKRGAVKVEPILKVRDGDHVVLHYDSRLPVRVLGWILLIGGSVGGGLLMASGLPAQDPNIPARVAGGATLLAASLGFGLWFANVPDRAFGWVTR